MSENFNMDLPSVESRKILGLTNSWFNLGQITDDELPSGTITQEQYAKKAAAVEQFGEERSEKSKFAEVMVAEGFEQDGMLKQHYQWFGPEGTAVLAHPYDDIRRQTDVIVALTESSSLRPDQKEATLLAIDVTYDPDKIPAKIRTTYEDVSNFTNLSKLGGRHDVLWADVNAKNIVEPQAGLVAAVHVVVEVPNEILEKMTAPGVNFTAARESMDALGRTVVAQIQAQLQMKALCILGKILIAAKGNDYVWTGQKVNATELMDLLDVEKLESQPKEKALTLWEIKKILKACDEAIKRFTTASGAGVPDIGRMKPLMPDFPLK